MIFKQGAIQMKPKNYNRTVVIAKTGKETFVKITRWKSGRTTMQSLGAATRHILNCYDEKRLSHVLSNMKPDSVNVELDGDFTSLVFLYAGDYYV
jgi:hypothetical protein